MLIVIVMMALALTGEGAPSLQLILLTHMLQILVDLLLDLSLVR